VIDRTSPAIADLLFRLVNETWRGLTFDEFFKRYKNEVSSLTDTVYRFHYDPSGTELYELHNGMVAVCTKNGRWSLWETRQRAEQRDHERAWGEFSRGTWTKTVPSEEGQYFVRDRDTGRRSVRELKRVSGRLLDVSGGMVRLGKVSEWKGDWWTPKVPRLPGSWS
jgi:hypothetical protein